MADDQGRRAGGGQLLLQGLDGQDVQVVGGLVEQDDVGVLGEGAGQRRAADLAAGEALGGLFGVETEIGEPCLSLVVLGAAGRGVVEQGRAGDLRLLWHEGDAGPRRDVALAAVRLDLAGQDAQQRRLAGAVAAHQAGADPRIEGQVDAVEQHQRTVGEPDVLQGEDWRFHLSGLR